jgi:hypothetical protein
MSDNARLDRIEAALELLTTDLGILRGAAALTDHHLDSLREGVRELTASVAITDEQVRRIWELHADTREDIHHLYAAWPAHLRENHGGPSS